MEPVVIKATYNTPKVNFDPKSGVLELSGRSIPEHANIFFRPLIDWLKNYVASKPSSTKMNVSLDYVNSSSHKFLLEVFENLEPIARNSGEITVNWYYEEDDEEMKEAGEEFSECTAVPFKIIKVEEFDLDL